MNFLVKKSIKLISYQIDTGISFSHLCEKLIKEYPNISFISDDLKSELQKLSNLKYNNMSDMFICDRQTIENYTHSNILKLFILDNEEKTEAIKLIYEEIIKSGPIGINYLELAKKVNCLLKKSKKKTNIKPLEINMISHYCRKLVNCNLIDIRMADNCKIVTSKLFSKEEKFHKKIVLDLEEEKRDQISSRISKSFYFKELTFKQNLLSNLLSAEANFKKGLSLVELCERLGKPGETKMLNRFISKLMTKYNIIAKPDRQGRMYSFVYYIENKSYPENFQLIEEPKPENNKNNEQLIQNCLNEYKIDDKPILNFDAFVKLINIFKSKEIYINGIDQTESEAKLFFFGPKNISKNINQKDVEIFFNNHKKEYIHFSEIMLKILVEHVEIPKIEEVKTNFSKRQVSSLKLVRYLIILNEIYLNLVLPIFKLKQIILEKESKKGIGKIDRKTIIHMVETLEILGIVKLKYVDLGTPIFKIKEDSIMARNFFKKGNNVVVLENCPDEEEKIQKLLGGIINTKKEENIVAMKKKVEKKEQDKDKENKKNGIKVNIKKKNDAIFNMDNIKKEEEEIVDSNSKTIFSAMKIESYEYKAKEIGNYFEKLFEKLSLRNKIFAFQNLKIDYEEEIISKFLGKKMTFQQRKNNFYYFSKKFEVVNFPKSQSEFGLKKIEFDEVLNEIDEKIKLIEDYEIPYKKIKNEENNSVNLIMTTERKKLEENFQKMAELIMKNPIRRMKEIENRAGVLIDHSKIWKTFSKKGLIKVYKQNDEEILNGFSYPLIRNEDYYYKTTNDLYEYF